MKFGRARVIETVRGFVVEIDGGGGGGGGVSGY